MLFVMLLACQASDLLAFAAPEPCALGATASLPDQDQQCPPTCARCACCAQAVVIAEPFLLVRTSVPLDPEPTLAAPVPTGAASDVLHVPKSVRLL
jgi:hypothetical protein